MSYLFSSSRNDPSVTDIENQRMYQRLFKDKSSTTSAVSCTNFVASEAEAARINLTEASVCADAFEVQQSNSTEETEFALSPSLQSSESGRIPCPPAKRARLVKSAISADSVMHIYLFRCSWR